MSSEAVEYVRGISVVKVFQQTIFSFKRFYDSIIAYRDLVTKYTLGWQKPMSLYTVAINSFAFLLVPVVILLIGNKSENIAPIITDMFLYVLITPVIATNVMKVMYLQQDMFLADQAISRVENLTSSEPLPIAENPEKITACDVTFENVSFAYPNAGQNAVDGISFHSPKGRLLPLWGNREEGRPPLPNSFPAFGTYQQVV